MPQRHGSVAARDCLRQCLSNVLVIEAGSLTAPPTFGDVAIAAAGALRSCLIAQSPIKAISRPAEAAAAVSTMATASVRKYGPRRRQLEGSGGRDARLCTRCAVGSKPGGGAMGAGAASIVPL